MSNPRVAFLIEQVNQQALLSIMERYHISRLLSLPPELRLMIASFLEVRGLACLAITCNLAWRETKPLFEERRKWIPPWGSMKTEDMSEEDIRPSCCLGGYGSEGY